MCRVSYTLVAGALFLATLLKGSSAFTLHRFDQINEDPREVSFDSQHPATATGADDELATPSQDRLFKRSALPPVHQLTAAEWQLLLQQMIGQHNVDSSDERNLLRQNVQHHTLSPDDEGRGEVFNRQQLDASNELDDDLSWEEVKDVELLKKLFGITWESVKDMKFDHASTEDLIEDWIRTQNKAENHKLA